MALKEYIEVKPITKKRIENIRRVLLEVFQVFIQTIVPFVCGFYFFATKNILFLIPVLIVMVFNISIQVKD